MAKNNIREFKNCEGSYTIMDIKSGISVDIEKIYEYSAIGRTPVRYRVDMNGKTRYSMIPLTEAKKYARQLVKKELEKIA